MKVAIFFDGKNFYKALTQSYPGLQIDYERLAEWITKTVGGTAATFSGAYYYTGYESTNSPGSKGLWKFLRGLELQRGYFVKREPRVARTARCKRCGGTYQYRAEKRVDSRLVADLIHFGAVNAFDIAVIASGDQDLIPAVEAANALGKQVYVAVWRGRGLSRELRTRCFGQINLEQGVISFKTSSSRSRPIRYSTPQVTPAARESLPSTSSENLKENLLAELTRCGKKLPYISKWYFINKWESSVLPPLGPEREKAVNALIEEGILEEQQVKDKKGRSDTAINRKVSGVSEPKLEVYRA